MALYAEEVSPILCTIPQYISGITRGIEAKALLPYLSEFSCENHGKGEFYLGNHQFAATSALIYKNSLFASNLYNRGDVLSNEIVRNLAEFEKKTKFIQGSYRKFNVSMNFSENSFVTGCDMGRYASLIALWGMGEN